MNPKLKEYALSTLITFVTGALISLSSAIETATTFADISWKIVISASILAGLRLSIKGVIEYLPKLISIFTEK